MIEGSKEEIHGLLDNAANRTINNIKNVAFIAIDTRPIMGSNDGKVFEFIYEDYSSVFELINDIWHVMSSKVPAFTYGKKWILINESNGKIILEKDFDKINDLYDCSDYLFSKRLDYLLNVKLSDAGINSGDSLKVIPVEKK
jgi:hypothetical protein